MRRDTMVFGWVLLFLGAWSSARASEPALRFAWPVPSHVLVTQTTLKKEKTAKLRYRVDLEKDPKGEHLLMRMSNFAFLEIQGVDLEEPAAQAELAQARAMASLVPVTVVGADGRFVDIQGLDEMLTRLLATLPEKSRAATERLVRSPQMQAALKAKSADLWKMWVAMWLDVELDATGRAAGTQVIPMPDGSRVDSPYTVIRGAADPARPGNVVLAFESTLEGDAARKGLSGTLAQMLAQGDLGAKAPAAEIIGLQRVMRIRISTDPRTMRPASVSSETLTTLQFQGQPAMTRTEKNDYDFAWQ